MRISCPPALTVDLLRPARKMAPLRVEDVGPAGGQTDQIVDAEVLQRHRGVLGEFGVPAPRRPPDGEVWGSPTVMPPIPDDSAVSTDQMPFVLWAFGSDTEDPARWAAPGSKWQQAGRASSPGCANCVRSSPASR